MNKAFLGGVVVLCLLWFFAPAYQKDKVYGLVDNNIERQCFNYYKSSLDNPGTAYLIKSGIPQHTQSYKINVKATNVYGAYQNFSFDCVAKNGKFDSAATLNAEVKDLLSD